jgi:hypothetical protein
MKIRVVVVLLDLFSILDFAAAICSGTATQLKFRFLPFRVNMVWP